MFIRAPNFLTDGFLTSIIVIVFVLVYFTVPAVETRIILRKQSVSLQFFFQVTVGSRSLIVLVILYLSVNGKNLFR